MLMTFKTKAQAKQVVEQRVEVEDGGLEYEHTFMADFWAIKIFRTEYLREYGGRPERVFVGFLCDDGILERAK